MKKIIHVFSFLIAFISISWSLVFSMEFDLLKPPPMDPVFKFTCATAIPIDENGLRKGLFSENSLKIKSIKKIDAPPYEVIVTDTDGQSFLVSFEHKEFLKIPSKAFNAKNARIRRDTKNNAILIAQNYSHYTFYNISTKEIVNINSDDFKVTNDRYLIIGNSKLPHKALTEVDNIHDHILVDNTRIFTRDIPDTAFDLNAVDNGLLENKRLLMRHCYHVTDDGTAYCVHGNKISKWKKFSHIKDDIKNLFQSYWNNLEKFNNFDN